MCTQQLLALILFPCWNHLPDPPNYKSLTSFCAKQTKIKITQTIADFDISIEDVLNKAALILNIDEYVLY